jgi:hypothetical protein
MPVARRPLVPVLHLSYSIAGALGLLIYPALPTALILAWAFKRRRKAHRWFLACIGQHAAFVTTPGSACGFETRKRRAIIASANYNVFRYSISARLSLSGKLVPK